MKKYLVSGIASIVMTAVSMALIVLSVQTNPTELSQHAGVVTISTAH